MTTRPLFTALLFTASVASAQIAPLNRDQPSAIARADDILVEARLIQDTITSGETIGVSYDVHNLTQSSIAIAERLCSASYDADSRTVTLSIGSEILEGLSRRLAIIPPGIKKTFTTGALLRIIKPGSAVAATTPRYVQIKVNVLRDWNTQSTAVTDQMFDKWLDSNDSILLNALPVHYGRSAQSHLAADAEVR